MCHSNLDIDMERHRDLFQWKKQVSTRLFTLSQGQFDITFPAGFGLPIFSDEVFSLNTQVLKSGRVWSKILRPLDRKTWP